MEGTQALYSLVNVKDMYVLKTLPEMKPYLSIEFILGVPKYIIGDASRGYLNFNQ